MQPVATIHRSTPAINTTLTVGITADADTTQRALNQFDLTDQAMRAIHALGVADHVVLTPGGLSWRRDSRSGQIDVEIDTYVAADSEDSTWLTIITRISATDERTHDRLLDAWPLLNPLGRSVVQRAARAVKNYAEADRFEEGLTSNEEPLAA